MLQSVIPIQTSPEGKFSNFFQLAKDKNNGNKKWKNMKTNLSQMENEMNENSNQNNNNNELDEDEEDYIKKKK